VLQNKIDKKAVNQNKRKRCLNQIIHRGVKRPEEKEN
jgi:hypothetical protein